MKNIQTEYWKAASTQPIPNNLFARTKERMRQEAMRSPKVRWSVLAPVCALAVLVTASAMAYGTYCFTHPPYQPRINSSVPLAVTQKAGAAVGKTDVSGNLAITIRQTVCDNQKLYLSLEVKSKDGSPLQESSEFRKSQLAREKFSQANLQIDGKSFECNLFRTDNASVPDKASFELFSPGNFTGMSGKPATLTLKDLTDEVTTCEDAGFLFHDLGQLYTKMTPEKPQNFIKTGLYNVYEDKSLVVPSWTIPAGGQKIKFSKQFPNASIDNVGFHKTGEYGCQKDVFYISIMPGNQSEVPALKKLCFQNTNTMQPIYFEDYILTGNGIEQNSSFTSEKDYKKACQKDAERKLAYTGKRVVIALSTFFDSGARSSDCSVNDLSHYRLVKNYRTENVVRCAGTWSIPFTLRFQDTTRNFTPDAEIKTKMGHPVTIQNITVSDLSLAFSGKCHDLAYASDDIEKADLSINHIKLILKNGSVVDAGVKMGGDMNADGSFKFSGGLQSFVDSDSVTAVQIFGARIPLVNKK